MSNNPQKPMYPVVERIEPDTLFRIKGKDWTLFVERRDLNGNPLLCVVFLPENIVSNVPDNRFDARMYQQIKKHGVEYIDEETFMEVWNERAGKYSKFKKLPEWVKFAEERQS